MPGSARNPWAPFHTRDLQRYSDLIKTACGCSAKTAQQIAETFPGGDGLLYATPAALRHLGATAKQAERLLAGLELAAFSRIHGAGSKPRPGRGPLRRPSDAASYLRGRFGSDPQESFLAVLLDSRQRVIDVIVVAQGSLAQVDVHPRELFRDPIRLRAHSILLAHNHPSGDHEPSQADLKLTKRMAKVGRMVGIPVVDHLVVTAHGSTSLAARGLI